MIHAKVNGVGSGDIIGFETGTRGDFDRLHAGDKSWVFLDYNVVRFRIVVEDFLRYPTTYYIDPKSGLQKHNSNIPGQVRRTTVTYVVQ